MVTPLIPYSGVAGVLNSMRKQATGEIPIVKDDLTNIADYGMAMSEESDYVQDIVNSQMGTMITEQLFYHQTYRGNGVDIVRSVGPLSESDGIVQINRPVLTDLLDDKDVYDPEPYSSSDPFVNYPIEVVTDLFARKFQFGQKYSIPERWMWGRVKSAEKMYEFVNMIHGHIKNTLAIAMENITMGAITSSAVVNLAEVTDIGGKGTERARNVIAHFNETQPDVPADWAGFFTNPDALRHALGQILNVTDLMESPSAVFNNGNYLTFTNRENQHVILLKSFLRAVEQYLLSDTYHEEYLKLPKHGSVNSWKGIKLTADEMITPSALSAINASVKVPWLEEAVSVDMTGIIAMVFDENRVGLHRFGIKETSQYDVEGLKTNYFVHAAGQTIIDSKSNCVVFYAADPTEGEGD